MNRRATELCRRRAVEEHILCQHGARSAATTLPAACGIEHVVPGVNGGRCGLSD